MSGLKSIRKRIGSVKNTQKITRAMKMVAAARLRRAQQTIVELRPVANKTLEVLSTVVARIEAEKGFDDAPLHPLLARREAKHVLLVVLASDRGLAGAFNMNVCRRAWNMYQEFNASGCQTEVYVVGRKAREYFKRRHANIVKEFVGFTQHVSVEHAVDIGLNIVHAFTKEKYDAVHVVYNEFKSAISQNTVSTTILPVTPMDLSNAPPVDFLYEPSRKAVLDELLPLYVELEIYRALLESQASEHGARMTAMEAATGNAAKMISSLTLKYNRARQAAITKELMEIIGGAEALKG